MPIAILTCLVLIFVFTAAVTGVINYRNSQRPMLFLVCLLVYTFISETGAYWAARLIRDSRIFYPIYRIVSSILFTVFFYEVITNSKIRKVMLVLGILLISFSIITPFFLENFLSQDGSVLKAIVPYLFLGGCVLLFQQLEIPGNRRLFKDPVFLAGLSLVFANLISSFNLFFRGITTKYHLQVPIIIYSHYFSNYVHYLIFFVAMIYLKNYKNYAPGIHERPR